MKKIILGLTLLVSQYSTAQVVVSAPILEAQEIEKQMIMKKDVAETIKQTKTLSDSYKKAEESVDIFKKVSEALKNMALISTIIQKQINLVKTASETLMKINKMDLTTEYKSSAKKEIESILAQGDDLIELVKTLMKNDGINATDGERISLLRDIEKDQQGLNSSLLKKQDDYSYYAMIRTMSKTKRK